MFRRIVVPLDGSETAEAALPHAQTLAEQFNIPITLVRAYAGPRQSARTLAIAPARPDGVPEPGTVELLMEAADAAEEGADEYIERMVERLRPAGLTVNGVTGDATAADLIVEEAGREPDTLIVLCTHGRGGLGRALLGSVAQDVMHRATMPVLLVRAYVSREDAELGGEPMNVTGGAEVQGTSGKLGEVSRVVLDARSLKVTDLVVKHGGLFGGKEWMVPIGMVKGVEGNRVHLELDEQGLEGLTAFTNEKVSGPDPDYVGTPSGDLEGTFRGNTTVDTAVAMGAQGYLGSTVKPMGYPGGENLAPDYNQRPALSEGMTVLDRDGEKVGEVGGFALDARDGSLTGLTVKSGFIFKDETDIPMEWVNGVTEDEVVLNVAKAEAEPRG